MQNLILPNHLGVILDGNRRWAKARGLPAWAGHREGAKTLENFLNWCMELGINQVSVYALSTENLNRPKREVEEIFKVLYKYLERWERGKSDFLDKYNVRVRFVGDLSRLPPKLVRLMGKIMEKTAKHQKRALNLLIAYGSKFELTNVLKKIAEKMLTLGRIEITEKDIESNLLLPTPVDLIIRTGGEYRLSNFLLWQSAYSELIFLKKFWPDFTKQDLIRCLREYSRRQRRFGR
jgi:undecaprenyl diphosphate synthase